jgi:hypothetical protein
MVERIERYMTREMSKQTPTREGNERTRGRTDLYDHPRRVREMQLRGLQRERRGRCTDAPRNAAHRRFERSARRGEELNVRRAQLQARRCDALGAVDEEVERELLPDGIVRSEDVAAAAGELGAPHGVHLECERGPWREK